MKECSTVGVEIRAWSQVQWLTSVILATWEVDIRRVIVEGQPRPKVSETSAQQIIWASAKN
jgi:hypothetical protein